MLTQVLYFLSLFLLLYCTYVFVTDRIMYPQPARQTRVIRITYPNIENEPINFQTQQEARDERQDPENVHDHQVQSDYKAWLDCLVPEPPSLEQLKFSSPEAVETYPHGSKLG